MGAYKVLAEGVGSPYNDEALATVEGRLVVCGRGMALARLSDYFLVPALDFGQWSLEHPHHCY